MKPLLLLLLVLLPVGGETVHGSSPSGCPLYAVQTVDELNAVHHNDELEYDYRAHYQPSSPSPLEEVYRRASCWLRNAQLACDNAHTLTEVRKARQELRLFKTYKKFLKLALCDVASGVAGVELAPSYGPDSDLTRESPWRA